MAIGFTPSYTEEFLLDGLTPEQFIVIAHEAAHELGWNVSVISDNRFQAHTNSGMFSFNAKIDISIYYDTAHIISTSAGSEVDDQAKNKETIEKFIEKFNELKWKFSTDYLDAKYSELKENTQQPVPEPDAPAAKFNFFSIFIPSKELAITPLLIDINILVFIFMALSGVSIFEPDSKSLLDWGANFRPYTLDGQWWRLFTCMFLHIGILHLLMNMYALLFIGQLLEPHLGKSRFLGAYLLAGIAASATSLGWHDVIISAGASGAIFGMYGVFLALLTGNFIEKTKRKALLTSIGFFVAFNLLYGLKGGIDNSAHIGGLISGLLMGYAFIPSLRKPTAENLKISTIAASAIAVLIFSVSIYKNTTNDIAIYDAKMKQFSVSEKIALAVLSLPKTSSKELILYGLKENGIYYWNENVVLLESVRKLKLPDAVRRKNNLLMEYCDLRIKNYELMYKKFDEETDEYDDAISESNTQLKALIDEIKSLNKTKNQD